MAKRRYKPIPREEEAQHKLNGRIRVPEVRIVGDDVEQGVYPIARALEMAQEMELDLVEISPNAVPPVCRITDYKKFLYEKKKKEKEIKAKASKTVIKEIRFTANTDSHDVDFKVKHAEKFLQEGAKVKAYVHFKGRAIIFKERGELLLLQFYEALKDIGDLEQLPKLEGKRMTVFISPKKKKS